MSQPPVLDVPLVLDTGRSSRSADSAGGNGDSEFAGGACNGSSRGTGDAGGGAGGTKKRNEDTPETLKKEEKHRTPLHNARRTTS